MLCRVGRGNDMGGRHPEDVEGRAEMEMRECLASLRSRR